ncbi:MAG: oxidoreductase [Planctomycetes bacterium RBG_16_43_13]|nr:MAG: oxidoreductase [Planctomycetes bacterium RBG_16_43_13]
MLTIMVFAPTAGAFLLLLAPRGRNFLVKTIAAVATAVPLLLAVCLFVKFDNVNAGFQFAEKHSWIKAFDVNYYVAVDGISVTMVMLTALLSFLCIFASWNIEEWKTNKGIKGYFFLFLLLETGMMGVFCALDFFLFYVFWELMLLPMYFLIGIWGGGRKEYSAIKFFLYTLAGSVLILIVMLAFYFSTEPHTFDLTKLMEQRNTFVGTWWLLAFIGLYIGFAIKVPVFPFHTWLPDAHVDAPTPVSVILAGVLLKMGTYGLLRISYPILPEAARWFAPILMAFGVINIIYGALCAMAQIRGVERKDPVTGERYIEHDWKKLVAYSSISHMGYCLIGMAACTQEGMMGALFNMWNHGLSAGMLFLLVGVIYDRAHHRNIDGFGGLWTKMPYYGGITALAFFAALGLPGLANFISEILCFIGAFMAGTPYFMVMTAVAVIGVVLGAAYLLWSYQKIFLGPLNEKYANISDVNGRELFTLLPLAALIVILGVFPSPILDMISGSLNELVKVMAMPWVKF